MTECHPTAAPTIGPGKREIMHQAKETLPEIAVSHNKGPGPGMGVALVALPATCGGGVVLTGWHRHCRGPAKQREGIPAQVKGELWGPAGNWEWRIVG